MATEETIQRVDALLGAEHFDESVASERELLCRTPNLPGRKTALPTDQMTRSLVCGGDH